MPFARIKKIASHLPEQRLTNDMLAELHPEWNMPQLEAKTGIRARHVAAADECASDLACQACEKLFAQPGCDKASVDYLLLCTQTPDYLLPTTACLMQHRLGLDQCIGALDINMGCSGYVNGLSLAKGLIESGQARNVVFVTADTYSKITNRSERNLTTIFGDGAAATWIEAGNDQEEESIGPFAFGTDGGGASHLILEKGGARKPFPDSPDDPGRFVYMNGAEVFKFSAREVPPLVKRLLTQANLPLDQVDWFVFHQANDFMLDHLRRKMGVPSEKFLTHFADCGNTGSSSIPLLLDNASSKGTFKPGDTIMLVGFGVGLSWAGTLIKW